MRVRRMGVESEQVTVGRLRRARGQRPGPQFPRPGQPVRRDGLHRAAGPGRGHRDQPPVDRGADQRSVLVGAADLGDEPCFGDHLGKPLGTPQPIHHNRQARRLLRTATDQHDLARRSENPGQVGDRGRHRLSREERQLTHEIDTRPAVHSRGVTGPHEAAGECGENEKTPVRQSPGRAGGSFRSSSIQTGLTLRACGPLGLCSISNSTF
ncbi:MAG: hypothetical protein QOG79_2597 [Mycobacterium sp.]|nr:hypothetical protein [Mycobacterium sp.]